VIASDVSEYTAATLFPEIVEACFRRLVPAYVEKLPAPKTEGLVLASLHDKDQDAKLFPATPDASLADARRGAQQLKFRSGQVARVAVLAQAVKPTVATVQWWSPSERPETCSSKWLPGGKTEDLFFDLPVDKLGAWRVRVAFGDTIVLDEKFFVTAK